MTEEFGKEKIAITCPDGVILRGTLLQPFQPRAVIQFNGGTAMRKEFYLPFLSFLASHGFICCLWDYRGSGESRPLTLKGCTYSFSDYGTKDMPAVSKYLQQRFPELPFLIVAHSVGGQQIGFMNDLEHVRGMVGFSVSTGYFGYMPALYCLQSLYFFYLFSPLSILLSGYIASKRFGYMEDLPKNVVREWRSWCWKKEYFFDKKFSGKSVPPGTFKNIQFPVQLYWSSDDPIANRWSVPVYLRHIKSTESVGVKEVNPEAYGLRSIGHMGFFKRIFKDTVWKETLDVLINFLAAEPIMLNKTKPDA
jgi:predicted alpha/beta hydrolase